MYSTKIAELLSLAVHHEYRNAGVGKSLVDHCVQRAHDLGIMEIMAISSSEDFFQSCGFGFSLPDQKKAFFRQLRPRHPE
ncbi:GNAT family N-acetyltransferase [Novipirellula herctigrandis]